MPQISYLNTVTKFQHLLSIHVWSKSPKTIFKNILKTKEYVQWKETPNKRIKQISISYISLFMTYSKKLFVKILNNVNGVVLCICINNWKLPQIFVVQKYFRVINITQVQKNYHLCIIYAYKRKSMRPSLNIVYYYSASRGSVKRIYVSRFNFIDSHYFSRVFGFHHEIIPY